MPPANEQRRIVAKIEELFGEIEAGEQELEKAREGLAAYRRAILKAAATGELTREWREKNPPNETGADLLTRILTERRATWERAELAKMEARAKRPTNGAWKARYPEPIALDTDTLIELPHGWMWASLDQLVSDCPSNGYSPPSTSASSGTLSLKLTATTSGKLRLDEAATKRIDEIIDRDSKYWLRSGDILLQRGNTLEYVGWQGYLMDRRTRTSSLI